MAELTARQWQAIEHGRQAMRQVLMRAYPGDHARLWASAITADFVAVCSASLHERELVDVVNAGLADVGLKLAPVRRQ